MKKKVASQEARDKMSQEDAVQVWTANCRWCGKPERGTMADMREAAKKHGFGRCKEIVNGS